MSINLDLESVWLYFDHMLRFNQSQQDNNVIDNPQQDLSQPDSKEMYRDDWEITNCCQDNVFERFAWPFDFSKCSIWYEDDIQQIS